jgi:FkbM family methyltransferase
LESSRNLYLGRDRVLAQTKWGGWIEVPTFNVDVAVGPIRDGIIEPWTTRLVQELLRVGQVYFNAGANFGYYVSLGGGIVGSSGRVLAAEPNPFVLPYLLHTIYWSGIVDRVKVFNVALGSGDAVPLKFTFDPQYMGGAARTDLLMDHQLTKRHVESLEAAIWRDDNISHLFDENNEWKRERCNRVSFSATQRSIDELSAGLNVDLLHLDIEGSESLALLGARSTIERSENIKLITEWSADHYRNGTPEMRAAFNEFWTFAARHRFRVRRIEPRLGDDGGLNISQPLTSETMTTQAAHGDYVWIRPEHDPW